MALLSISFWMARINSATSPHALAASYAQPGRSVSRSPFAPVSVSVPAALVSRASDAAGATARLPSVLSKTRYQVAILWLLGLHCPILACLLLSALVSSCRRDVVAAALKDCNRCIFASLPLRLPAAAAVDVGSRSPFLPLVVTIERSAGLT